MVTLLNLSINGLAASDVFTTVYTVSYTHLDVYKRQLVLYLLVSLVASCIYPVTVWAKVNERFSLKNESVSEQIPLTKKVRDRKSTRLNSSHITRSRMPSSA